ncbi:hexokinase domain-containing protein [Sarocladium implicatum]|nr:hexokinase domain-containing protein [Sarocladium implicatum]
MAASDMPRDGLDDFLAPLHIDLDKAHDLSRRFLKNFRELSATSTSQFLPTPISDAILRPISDRDHSRYLAIDIGGTNLRVGFIDLLGKQPHQHDDLTPNGHIPRFVKPTDRIKRHLEKSWPIDDHLKNENEGSLFLWIGQCIAEVVARGCETFHLPRDEPLWLGVTFSFPMKQQSLSEATVMAMGKGFAVSSNADLGLSLQKGYDKANESGLPPIRVAAIANDSVSTLVSFIFQYDETVRRRASMGLILGTGSNATVPLKLRSLHRDKWPPNVSLLPGEKIEDVKITVNTEWSINGTAPPMRELGLISRWDEVLDSQNETPGFQPLEYMTAGRYLGELGRIMLLDYMKSKKSVEEGLLPEKLRQRHGLTTTFLSHFKPLEATKLLPKLREEFPESSAAADFAWTEDLAEALYKIAKAIEFRAAGVIAAATLALLEIAEEIPGEHAPGAMPAEVGVGYTGGCIVHFQDYLNDCQKFIDDLVKREFGEEDKCKVTLVPCHDGGITGAGILVAAGAASKRADM